MPDEIYFVEAPEPIGGVVFMHGQGDHVRRHLATFEALTQHGIAVAAPELPGHGVAGGRRGHIPGTRVVDDLIERASTMLAQRVPGLPLGIAGHSMGGLLVADHFARGNGSDFRWVWLSSPLIDAGHGKSGCLLVGGRWMSRIWPSFTIPTGVTPGDNHEGGADPERVARERASGTHNRVSVGWGMELLRASERVAAAAPSLFGDRPVHFTHGDEDRVCPHRFSRELFDQLPSGDKQYTEVSGARHEPWQDDELVAGVARWMAKRASASGSS